MKILCLGQSAYDITIPVDEYPIENKKIKVHEVYGCGGGAANNAAYLLAKWHDEVYLASAVGCDDYGKKITKELEKIGVKTDYMEEIENVNSTTSYIIANKNNGSRTIITNASENMQYKRDINEKFDVILFDGYYLEAALEVIEKNKEAIKIIDAGRLKKETVELAKYCDYIVCSNDFAREYTGINFDYNEMDKIGKVYDMISKDFNGKLIITLEEHGSLTKINDEFKHIPSIKVESLDSTGAGDIYHGAFTHFIANGYSLLDTMHYANIAGALSVKKIGSKNSMSNLEDVINCHEL